VSKAEIILKENKLSITEARKAILEVFLQKKRPLTVKDIKKIKSLAQVNESSIYRNLSKLEEKGIISSIPSTGEFQTFELTPKGHHHHHISCTNCDKVVCLDICGLDKRMKEMAEHAGFELTGHSVELMGLCKKCR